MKGLKEIRGWLEPCDVLNETSVSEVVEKRHVMETATAELPAVSKKWRGGANKARGGREHVHSGLLIYLNDASRTGSHASSIIFLDRRATDDSTDRSRQRPPRLSLRRVESTIQKRK